MIFCMRAEGTLPDNVMALSWLGGVDVDLQELFVRGLVRQSTDSSTAPSLLNPCEILSVPRLPLASPSSPSYSDSSLTLHSSPDLQSKPRSSPSSQFFASLTAAQQASFEEFWSVFPARYGRKAGRRDTEAEWAKLDDVAAQEVISAAMNYARHCRQHDQIPRDPCRFLKNDFWREFVTAPEPIVSKPKTTGPLTRVWGEMGLL
jgi:hypothetical protein